MPQRARKVRTRYLASALVVLVMIGCGVITSALNTRRNLEDARLVSHSWSVLTALRKSLSAMQDLELGQRGYIIVGESNYLEPYYQSLVALDTRLEEVEMLTRDDPSQHEKAKLLGKAAELKKAYLARTIDIRSTEGEEEVSRISATGEGKALMDAFRQQIAVMERVEQKLLSERQYGLLESLTQTNLIVALTGGAAVLSTAIGVMVLFFYLKGQERMDRINLDKEKAVQSDKAKSEFLAIMSHEIRTPMNAILGFGELLENSVSTEQQKLHARAIRTSGNSLLELINDILDLSKIEAGKLDIRPEPVDPRRFLENLETLFAYHASEKGIKYSIRTDADVPLVLLFDALRLRQIMVNLIGNALKFTRSGSVEVRVRMETVQGDTRDWFRFEVSDTGIGIAKDQQQQIFRPFYQIDSRNSRDFPGTGLGLNICERLAQALGGEILVVSELGQGSTFTLRIPVTRSDLAPSSIEKHLPKGVDDVLPTERVEEIMLVEPEELAKALTSLKETHWPGLVKLVPAQATIAFAEKIAFLGLRHGSAVLEEYASSLKRAAETFDQEKAASLLDDFPEIVSNHHFANA